MVWSSHPPVVVFAQVAHDAQHAGPRQWRYASMAAHRVDSAGIIVLRATFVWTQSPGGSAMNHEAPRHLYRSNQHRMIAGVAGGLAEYFNLDPTVVRVLLFLALLTMGPFGLLGYAVLAFLIPPTPTGGTTPL